MYFGKYLFSGGKDESGTIEVVNMKFSHRQTSSTDFITNFIAKFIGILH